MRTLYPAPVRAARAMAAPVAPSLIAFKFPKAVTSKAISITSTDLRATNKGTQAASRVARSTAWLRRFRCSSVSLGSR